MYFGLHFRAERVWSNVISVSEIVRWTGALEDDCFIRYRPENKIMPFPGWSESPTIIGGSMIE
jgi:hypothetical protein